MSPVRESHYIAAFLRRSFPTMSDWPHETAVFWVQWYMRHGRAIVAYEHGRMVAVCLFRLLDDPAQAKDFFTDTGGKVAYVEITAGAPGHMPVLFQCLRATVPTADTMAWERTKYNFRPTVVPMDRVARRFTCVRPQ